MYKLVLPPSRNKFRKPGVFDRLYGPKWPDFSFDIRNRVRKCQWCEKKFRHLSSLAGHHIGCVKFNPNHIYDVRIVISVCRSCHMVLEPWSKINLQQVLPQLFE